MYYDLKTLTVAKSMHCSSAVIRRRNITIEHMHYGHTADVMAL